MAVRIKKCRVCEEKNLVRIGSLGEIALSDFTKRKSAGIKLPLELVYCKNCSLLQLAHNFPKEKIYKNYWYESGINSEIRSNLKEIAGLVHGKVLIDIGCNDGTMFNFVKKGVYKIGVDPSNIKPENSDLFINNFFEDIKKPLKADTITAIACIYDLEDPNKFMTKIKNSLSQDGVFIAQLMTLSPMIENNDVGNICHEHIEYYSYKSLKYLFENNDLEIYKVEKNLINGGSYRIFARHFKKGSINYKEKEYSEGELKNFFTKIQENKDKFIKFYNENKNNIVGYGASTKANTILQYYGIKDLRIVDANPKKIGLFTVASSCLIIKDIPDCDYLWVFPYGFFNYFVKKEFKYKGKWVTSIPHLRIY